MSGRGWFGLVLALSLGASAAAQQPQEPCVLHKKIYTCSLAEFRRVFLPAARVALETDPGDKAAMRQLESLAARLGKQVVPLDQADVLLVMKSVPDNGVTVGPAGMDLARLQVFGPGEKGRFTRLLWSETYTSEPDHPWPLVLDALSMQFEESVKKSR